MVWGDQCMHWAPGTGMRQSTPLQHLLLLMPVVP